MAFRELAVFGLGRFGRSVAEAFASRGGNVIVIDASQEKINEIADKVTMAIRADVMEPDVIRQLGISNVDVAVIAIGENLEATIMAVVTCKEVGVPYVICKAQSDIQGEVLKKVGADEIVFPEKETGHKVGRNLIEGNFLDIADLSEEFSIVEKAVPASWIGKNLMELDLRNKYGFNLIAIRKDRKITVDFDIDKAFEEGEILIILGNNANLRKVFNK
ncbi:MAG: potassium channel family protein [Eubacterium sp.]